jgi:hypothetical protein
MAFYAVNKPSAYINQSLVALKQTPSFIKISSFTHHIFA